MTLLSLFRMATLEDWTDIMYINMFGCDIFGYGDAINTTGFNQTQLDEVDAMLIPPWSAFWLHFPEFLFRQM